MNNLTKKIIVSAFCLIASFAMVNSADAETFNYSDLSLSFESINISAGEIKITDLSITNNSDYLLENGQLTLEVKYDKKTFDGIGIDIWFSSVKDPYVWKSPDSNWQNGKVTFTGFEVESGTSIFYLKTESNLLLYPGNYIFSLSMKGQADTGETDTSVYVSPDDTEVTVSTTQYDIVINEDVENLATIIIPNNITNATIKLPVSDIDNKKIANTPANNDLKIQADTSAGEIEIIIPADTKITGSSDWTGVINIPTVKLNSSVTVIPDSGKTALVDSVIEIGFGDVELIFDKAVRILFAGKAGKYTGYSRGGVFTPIIATCGEDSQTWADINLSNGADCKIDSGSDLIVWTKHFTKFVTYTQAVIPYSLPTGGGGSSGGGDTTAPAISDINVSVTKTAAVITWSTNESSISWVFYGTSADDGKDIKEMEYGTSHSITLTNLSPGVVYYFQIKSKDSSGNIGSYTNKNFTTLSAEIAGDTNDDGKVDKYDFALMMSDWGKTGLNVPSDLNQDGKVDKYDFALLMVNWTI